MPSDFIAWHHQLYVVDRERCCPPEHVAKRERQLGFTLPPLLREIYLETSLRESAMVHLYTLDRLGWVGADVLTFAYEQQGCWSYGIHRSELGNDDPVIVSDSSGEFRPGPARLEQFLRFVALINRPFESPALAQTWVDEPRLVPPWERVVATLPDGDECELWTNGEAALDPGIGALGARDEPALLRAARSLGILEEGSDLRDDPDFY